MVVAVGRLVAAARLVPVGGMGARGPEGWPWGRPVTLFEAFPLHFEPPVATTSNSLRKPSAECASAGQLRAVLHVSAGAGRLP